jgi:hypothetical protein
MQAIQRLVTGQPGIGRNELLRMVGGHKPATQEAIDLLVEDGLITRHVDGQKHLHYPGTVPDPSPLFPPSPPSPTEPMGSAKPTGPQPYVVGARIGPGSTQETDTPAPTDLGPVPDTPAALDLDQLVGPPCPNCNARAGHTTNCPNQPDQNGWN